MVAAWTLKPSPQVGPRERGRILFSLPSPTRRGVGGEVERVRDEDSVEYPSFLVSYSSKKARSWALFFFLSMT